MAVALAVSLLAAAFGASVAGARSAAPTTQTTGGARATTSVTSTRALRRGLRGSDVVAAQRWLRTLGYRVHVTGVFGLETQRAVLGFERYHHLRRDGRLSPWDLVVLRRAAAAHGASTWGAGGSSRAAGRAQHPVAATATTAGLNADGTATAPTSAPPEIAEIIAAGNQIARTPYRYGGGHGSWDDTGYDCSGSVSYALHGAGLLDQPLTSGGFEAWGSRGPGRWVTIYANGGHVFMIVAGLRFDTSGATQAGTRWQTARRSTSRYVVRHPTGL